MNDLHRWEYPRVAAALMEKFDTVILIVEDEPVIRNLVRAIIQHEGYSFLLAANGEEAIALSRAYPGEIHLLLTDIKMPKMDGSELAAKIMSERPKIRILLMSGQASDEIREANLKLPFLRKPFMTQTLRDNLEKVFSGPPAKNHIA